MAYRKKSECEKEFVEQLLFQGGVIKHSEIEERGNTYHQFWIADGSIRFWTNMSVQNLKRLGLRESEDN